MHAEITDHVSLIAHVMDASPSLGAHATAQGAFNQIVKPLTFD